MRRCWAGLVYAGDLDVGRARIDHANRLCRSAREVQNAALDKRTAVIDAHDDGMTVGGVGNAQVSPERQRPVRRRMAIRIKMLSIGGL